MSPQLGQYSLTVSMPGMSERPQGRTCVEWQNTRGQRPKSPCSYFSSWRLVTLLHLARLTIIDSPGLVRMKRWCTRPYSSSADDSTIDTSGILAESSSESVSHARVTSKLTRLNVKNHLQRLLPEGNKGLQTCCVSSLPWSVSHSYSPVRLKSSSMKSS